MWVTNFEDQGATEGQLSDLATLMKHCRKTQAVWYDLSLKTSKAKRASLAIAKKFKVSLTSEFIPLRYQYTTIGFVVSDCIIKEAQPMVQYTTPPKRREEGQDGEEEEEEEDVKQLCPNASPHFK